MPASPLHPTSIHAQRRSDPGRTDDRLLAAGTLALLAFMAVSTIVGCIRNHSPVPYWDMWDGTLDFFMAIQEGRWSEWWAQHNEHRILLSRLLFYADNAWFGGTNVFLIAANVVLIGCVAALFRRLVADALVDERNRTVVLAMGAFAAAWVLSWMQHENLAQAFQSQFILAQLLPLVTFDCLRRAAERPGRTGTFALGVAAGVASAGTMANGVLALPLATVYVFATRQGPTRVAVLAVAAIATSVAYFHGYHAIVGHGSLSTALRTEPVRLVAYVLLYLGNPFATLVGNGRLSTAVGIAAGAAFCALAVRRFAMPGWPGAGGGSLRAWFTRARGDAGMLALLLFIAYLMATAVGTAGGRLVFGLRQATESRYTTPMLMGWAALFVLHAPAIVEAWRRHRRAVGAIVAAIAVALAANETRAWRSHADDLFEARVAALALGAGVHDDTQVMHVFPFVDWGLRIAQRAAARRIAIFGRPPFVLPDDAASRVATGPCDLRAVRLEAVPDDPRFVRLRAGVSAAKQTGPDNGARLRDARGDVVGFVAYGPVGIDGADAATVLVAGYLRADARAPIDLVDAWTACTTALPGDGTPR